VSWSCDFVGSYHNYQATNCCFSEDGSLLAVSFEETVTVWDSVTWDLKCTFCHPPGKIRYVFHLAFYVLNCQNRKNQFVVVGELVYVHINTEFNSLKKRL